MQQPGTGANKHLGSQRQAIDGYGWIHGQRVSNAEPRQKSHEDQGSSKAGPRLLYWSYGLPFGSGEARINQVANAEFIH